MRKFKSNYLRIVITDQWIGQNVARLRGDRAQRDVADAMRARGWKWSQTTVWKVESGERALRLAEAIDLEEVLGGPLQVSKEPSEVEADAATEALFGAFRSLRVAVARYDEARAALIAIVGAERAADVPPGVRAVELAAAGEFSITVRGPRG